MKVKSDYVLKEVAGQHIVVPTGHAAIDFRGVLTLNSSAKFLFELLSTHRTEGELVQHVVDKYRIREQQAQADVHEFIGLLRNRKMLDE